MWSGIYKQRATTVVIFTGIMNAIRYTDTLDMAFVLLILSRDIILMDTANERGITKLMYQ